MALSMLLPVLSVSIAASTAPPDLSLDRNGAVIVPPSVLVEGDPFRQIDEVLPTPNDFRTASGAPGSRYWQQKVDHDIEVELDPARAEITGRQKIVYHNNSPDELRYLWVQLDQNRFRRDSLGERAEPAPDLSTPQDIRTLRNLVEQAEWEGGYRDVLVQTVAGAPLATTVVDTMMRIDLPEPLAPGKSFAFQMSWRFAVVKNTVTRARSNYELLGEGDTERDPARKDADLAPLYVVAQFFPRLAPYNDVRGWQHKQFLGQGEFALEFGDYALAVTVPDTWTVGATGELQNPGDVLTPTQRERLAAAAGDEKPRFITTPEEAAERRAAKPASTRTWRFKADNVRDVAFGASAAFIWDAAKAPIPGTDRAALAMSYYPQEAEPLWSRYSTHAVAHTIDSLSRHAYPYPYPIAISVNGPVGGMEYPMISFNGPRPEKDGTYSAGTKWGLISVVIHEVTHNWFPMIINSDERQWTWLDEGLTTFCQFMAEQEWERKYPSGRGEPEKIVGYMTDPAQEPIMTNSESVRKLGPNAYAKPATALNVLRESVLGRELFDFAFAEYCRRWAFKRPEPADFFRTMEDASGVDLDWFWRGWFYTTRPVDIRIEKLTRYTLDTRDPDVVKAAKKSERDARPKTLSESRDAALEVRAGRFPELIDFYSTFDELDVTPEDRRRFQSLVARLGERDAALLDTPLHFTVARFLNDGGIPSPLPLRLTYVDGTFEETTIPAEIWRYAGGAEASKLFVTRKEIVRVELDRRRETADRDPSDNAFPQEIERSSFTVEPRERGTNPMREAAESERRERTLASARSLGRRAAAAIQAGKSAGSVVVDATERDGWDRAFVVLDGAEASSGGVAQVVSAGPDGAVGTEDDLTFIVMSDGEVRERVRRRGAQP
ncbi:MAG: M1 family metallopeptidase [Planctomycetaceae bacterium]|nr:M1 family metallopeptidase [Planctomycetaceae bacterium]